MAARASWPRAPPSLDLHRSDDPPRFDLSAYPQILQVVQQRERVVFDSLAHDPFELTVSLDEDSLEAGDAQGAALFPILDGEEVLGVLSLHLHALAPVLEPSQLPFMEQATGILAPALASIRKRMRRAAARVSQSYDSSDSSVAEHDLLVNLVEHSPNAVVAADLDGSVLVFNRAAEKLFGYARDQVLGRIRADDLMLPGAGQELRQQMARSESGDAGHVHNLQIEGLSATGEVIPLSVSAADLMEDGAPVATVRIYQDLRTRMALESRLQEMSAQLMESEKQATLAVLAGTTAHELNQPLTTIMGLVELLQFRTEGDDKLSNQLARVYTETERMSAIVQRIGRITRFSTTSYVGETEILDLDKSSE